MRIITAVLGLILLEAGLASTGTVCFGTVGDNPPFSYFDDAGEPTGERNVRHRGGTHDGGAARSLLPLLPRSLAAITLDIDDTCDAVHGHRQLSLFHAHYPELHVRT